MSDHPDHPDEAAGLADRLSLPKRAGLRGSVLSKLAALGVDCSGFESLSLNESDPIVRRWVEMGAERYGRLALVAPPGMRVMRGEFQDGIIPDWLDRGHRLVFVLFRDYRSEGLARCNWEFALANYADMARTDGDGFAAVTEELEGVLLVNVEEGLGDSVLEIEAWGELIARE